MAFQPNHSYELSHVMISLLIFVDGNCCWLLLLIVEHLWPVEIGLFEAFLGLGPKRLS